MTNVFAPTVHDITLATGVRLQYVEQGDRDGIPVVMLHGYTDSWHSFEPVLPLLPASIRAIAVTQRGHGDADRPETGYRGEDFAADVVALMDALGIDRAVIAAHSLSTWIAPHVATLAPQRVLGLVLMGGFASPRDSAVLVEFARDGIEPLRDPVPDEFVREFQLETTALPLEPALLDIFVRESRKLPAATWRAAFDVFIRSDITPVLRAVTAPTLLVWGEYDSFSDRAEQERILAAVPNSRLLEYKDTGHAMHWDRPERFANDLAAFVHEVAGVR